MFEYVADFVCNFAVETHFDGVMLGAHILRQ